MRKSHRPYLVTWPHSEAVQHNCKQRVWFVSARSPREAVGQVQSKIPFNVYFTKLQATLLRSGRELDHWSTRTKSFTIRFGHHIEEVRPA